MVEAQGRKRQKNNIPGHLPLHQAFFAPERLLSEGGVDPILRGLFAMRMKQPRSDQIMNSELTENLFGKRHEVALDLGALNIQRGRDHALPGYLQWREFCGLSTPDTFDGLRDDIPDATVTCSFRIMLISVRF
jgi:peroxidase